MSDRLSDFIPIRDWQLDNAGEVFKTFAACEWFVRKHRRELVESGQLIIRRGAAGSLVGPGFGTLVLEILKRESRAEVAA